jgi:hypothetical protein
MRFWRKKRTDDKVVGLNSPKHEIYPTTPMPDDVVTFGWDRVCENAHVVGFNRGEVDLEKKLHICHVCGGAQSLAVLKYTETWEWGIKNGWIHTRDYYQWNKKFKSAEFVKWI